MCVCCWRVMDSKGTALSIYGEMRTLQPSLAVELWDLVSTCLAAFIYSLLGRPCRSV